MERDKDKVLIGIAIFFIILSSTVTFLMLHEAYIYYSNLLDCDNHEIEIVFYPNVTFSEAYSLINSTGGEVVDYGEYYIGNVSDGSALGFTLKVNPGEENHYIEVYREYPEVYDAYKPHQVC